MQRNLKQVWLAAAASLVAFTSVSFANSDNAQMRNLENRVTALEQRRGANGVINPPGRPHVRGGADLYVTGDLLLWQAHEDGIPLYIENTGSATVPTLNHAEVKSLNWDWDWGFRIGLGYNTAHDGWDLLLNWMRVYSHASQRGHANNDQALWPSLSHPGAISSNSQPFGYGPFAKSHSHWKLQLNQIDLELGREFFVSKWLTLRPHFGLRTDWIHQKLHVHYNRFENIPGENYTVTLRNHFWGLGIAAGLDTQWGLGGGWSLYGNAAFALLYGFHDLDRVDDLENGGSLNFVDMDNSYRVSRGVGDLQIGIRWDTTFVEDRFHFGIQAGWEHHVYFGQNQFPRFLDNTALCDFVANQGDLTFQGWTLAARFDF